MSSAPNPYQPPQQPLHGPYRASPPHPRFEPLDTYAFLSIVAMAFNLAAAFGTDLFLLVASHASRAGSPLLLSLAALLELVSALASLAATISFLIWVYRAAQNLRALDRGGKIPSPGWCVGWFFVPLANFFMPYRVLSEIWDASDTGTGFGSHAFRRTPLIPLWWVTFLASKFLARFVTSLADGLQETAIVRLLGNGIGVAAAVSIALVMRDVGAHQAEIAGSAPAFKT